MVVTLHDNNGMRVCVYARGLMYCLLFLLLSTATDHYAGKFEISITSTLLIFAKD